MTRNDFPITVIGLSAGGLQDLPKETIAEIRSAKILVGGRRHLQHFGKVPQVKIPIEGDLDKVFAKVRRRFACDKTVVLATGDPLYFGIGDYLRRNFPAGQIVVMPHLSSVQLAFARIKESWHDARVVSLHGRPMECLHPALNEGAKKIAILTDEKNSPSAIAQELKDLGFGDARLWVLEDLGTAREKVSAGSVRELSGRTFSALNVVIVMRDAADKEQSLPVLGLADGFFEKRVICEGMLTKAEIRVLVLAKLALKPHMTLWDVGSATGSIAIEAKRLCPSLSVWAIEKNQQDVKRLKRNAQRALAGPMNIVQGEAPAILKEITEVPHRVFIGGHGGRLPEILRAVDKRLASQGRIVVNAILPETLHTTETFFQQRGYDHEVLRVSVIKKKSTQSEQQLHPIHICYGQKKR